jgi:hypothetical protein
MSAENSRGVLIGLCGGLLGFLSPEEDFILD